MLTNLNSPVSIHLFFDHKERRSFPLRIYWEGRMYRITKVGLHHAYREGRTLFHVFSVSTKTMFFQLTLNTETLHWQLTKVGDYEVG